MHARPVRCARLGVTPQKGTCTSARFHLPFQIRLSRTPFANDKCSSFFRHQHRIRGVSIFTLHLHSIRAQLSPSPSLDGPHGGAYGSCPSQPKSSGQPRQTKIRHARASVSHASVSQIAQSVCMDGAGQMKAPSVEGVLTAHALPSRRPRPLNFFVDWLCEIVRMQLTKKSIPDNINC